MAVRCSKCGEELLGAVNRCWKCGQAFAHRPETDGRPPVRAEMLLADGEPLAAVVLDKLPPGVDAVPVAAIVPPRAIFVAPARRPTTAEMIDARRAGMMAVGGAVSSLVLGGLGICLAGLWPPAAIIAVLGLAMGIWGLSSPRRNWALLGMLLCCLAIGLGAYGGARSAYLTIRRNKPVTIEDTSSPADER
jgi:hypothetical protein